MKLYHASNLIITNPDIYHSRKKLDFGIGFYLTPMYKQAKELCQRFLAKKNQKAFISKYVLDDKCFSKYNFLDFPEYSEEWLDFVLICRQGLDKSNYDLVMGGVADDRVFNTVELFIEGYIDKLEALKRLKYYKPNSQLCIRKQEILDNYLHFIESEEI